VEAIAKKAKDGELILVELGFAKKLQVIVIKRNDEAPMLCCRISTPLDEPLLVGKPAIDEEPEVAADAEVEASRELIQLGVANVVAVVLALDVEVGLWRIVVGDPSKEALREAGIGEADIDPLTPLIDLALLTGSL
jgi:hypothetical protein